MRPCTCPSWMPVGDDDACIRGAHQAFSAFRKTSETLLVMKLAILLVGNKKNTLAPPKCPGSDIFFPCLAGRTAI